MALQEAGRLVAGARDVGDLQAASAQLALAVEGGGAEWRYGLRFARDQARYSDVRGLLQHVSEVGGGTVFGVAGPVLGGVAAEGLVGGGLAVSGRMLLGLLGPWGAAAAAALGAYGLYLWWRGRRAQHEAGVGGGGLVAHGDGGVTVRPNLRGNSVNNGNAGDRILGGRPRVDERAGKPEPEFPITLDMRPSADAKDAQRAKAPGKPGEMEGFRDPRGGERWVKAKNGGSGWLDEDGTVWIPTGNGGLAHGGPHWDLQDRKGKFKGSVYPGGTHRR